MNHSSRQPMPPSAARITMLEAENEALRRRVAELEAALAGPQVSAATPRKAVFPQRAPSYPSQKKCPE